jgi:hypothetical protein
MSESQIIYCHYHPDIPTSLRCNRCNKPICAKEAVLTPVGYRCPECVRRQQDIFFNALPMDYFLAGVIALPLGYLAQQLGGRIGFFAILLGTLAGGIIGEVIWRATRRRRGRYTWAVALAGLFIGAGAVLWPRIVFALNGLGFGIVLWDIIFFVLMAGAAVARLRFGR